MHEPTIVGIVFPFLSRPPWLLRLTPKMFAVARTLRQMWEISDVAAGDLLRKLFVQARGFHSMPDGVVRRMLYSPTGKPVSGQVCGG